MPDLSTTLHVNMLRSRTLPRRIYRAVRQEIAQQPYGNQWGSPETVPPLRFVRDRWVRPYVDPSKTALEIGPGGGRWTRYLTGFKSLYVVDYHEELLHELARNVDAPNIVPVKNNGTDFPTIPDASIDFLFSFGTFVHFDHELIASYLVNMRRILKPSGSAVLHYSDKTKVMARETPSFSENDPERMRALVDTAGYAIIREDLTTLWHSSLIEFRRPEPLGPVG